MLELRWIRGPSCKEAIMSDRKHVEKGNETKAIKAKREDEQRPDKKPSEALSRLSANVAQPGDIKALQGTVGNRIVQRLIVKRSQPGVVQRHVSPETAAAYDEHFPAANADWELIGESVRAARDKLFEARDQGGSFVAHENAIQDHAYASMDYEEEGGGSESEQAEGGGGSESP
jgi:hypothetical protein